MTTVSPDDERPHLPDPDAGPGWCETWWFEVATADGAGVAVRVVSWPEQARTWYWAHVALPDGTRVAVRDHDLPLPAAGRLLVRGEQLWADHVAEEPLAFWTVGLETYGVRVDDPVAALESEYGERLPIAFDLEIESVAPAFVLAAGACDVDGVAEASVGFYEQVCSVHGEVHLGPSTSVALSGRGARGHSWGVPPWWTEWDGRACFQMGEVQATGLMIPGAGADADGYLWSAEVGGHRVEDLVEEVHRDASGIPVAARAVVNHVVDLDVDVVAAFPVALEDLRAPGGPGAGGHVVRCLCRVMTGDGYEGSGWAEWVRRPRAARG